jgi:OOP family OmpA-OmpF porin
MNATLMTVVAASLLVSGPVLAQDRDSRGNRAGFYIGAGVGDFSTDLNDISDVDEADLDFNDDDTALKVFAGWRFNRFFAFQVDYTDFGESSANTALLNVTSDTRGLAPTVVGTLPLGPIELFAKAGIMWYDLDVDIDGGQVFDDSGRDPVFGAGIGFTVAQRLNLRAEYEVVDIEGLDDAKAVWITAAWRF